MKRRLTRLSTGVLVLGCMAMGGCVIAPPRARVVAVAPAPVWVPGYWYGGVWVHGRWRYR
ncbi:MAG: hypothetical protein EPN40_02440 [Rhodanobacteraceae bacterium]|nr:MAG: hypothetical protein EPN40_02440 [Rhodanobacteraceae bacterium]